MDSYDGLREFVQARGAALTRAAFLLTGDAARAEELVQSALVKTAMRWRRVAAQGDPEAYVRKIMINEHISWWRQLGRREVSRSVIPDGVMRDQADHTAERVDLAAALAQLPARQRAVIVLRFYEDLSEADTAAALGCAVGTVKSQASDALAKLRRLIPAITDTSMEAAR